MLDSTPGFRHQPLLPIPKSHSRVSGITPAPTQHDQCDYQRLHDAIPDFKSFTVAQDSMINVENPLDVGLTYTEVGTKTDMKSWHEIMESSSSGFQTPFDLSVSSTWAATLEDNPERNCFTIHDF